MKLTIFLFAGLREKLGTSQLDVEIEGKQIRVFELKQHLVSRYPDAASIIVQSFVAKNQSYAPDDEIVGENDELALIPPVSGGQDVETPDSSGEPSTSLYAVTDKPIIAEEVARKVMHPDHGATLVFIGTTRQTTGGKKTVKLEYEAYGPMALKSMKQIGDEIAERWPKTKTAITHRTGEVGIGEISVVIAVSSPHRAACYEASRYAIERLKQMVPIWKKEIWEDGSEWKGPQSGPWNPIHPPN